MATRLRIGFIPEHFSTPLHFAHKNYGLSADLIPFATGTGALVAALKDPSRETGIDVAIGLTEGFVADLGKSHAADPTAPTAFALVGTYVESPLCWAISTGADRDEIQSIQDLKGSTVGVSRIGSGSYVMAFVLADQHGWLGDDASSAYKDLVPIGDFAALRKSVRVDKSSDFFMWEHFTTKHFWDNGELKRIGEIYTPWPSWMIAARSDVPSDRLADLGEKLNAGVKHYHDHPEEALTYISTAMHYSREDAIAWSKTVRFAADVRGVKASVVDDTVAVLRKAGVLTADAGGSAHMVRSVEGK